MYQRRISKPMNRGKKMFHLIYYSLRETNFRGAGTQYSESKSGWENYFRETRYIPKNEDRHAIGTGYTK
jgi:hypothetical protein